MNSTLQWLHDNEHPDGGIRAWPGFAAYPEVTGYLIPTLYEYGYEERSLATRCADWLLSIQQDNGAWLGMDRLPYTFDTAAVIQGLERACVETGSLAYAKATDRARAWIAQHRTPHALYTVRPGLGAPQHNIRVNGILQDNPGAYHINGTNRAHFIAYALEGYLSLGYADEVRGTLEALPFRADGLSFFSLDNWRGEGSDIIATCQLAILRMKTGLNAAAQIEAVKRTIHPNGGVPQALDVQTEMSWGAKFYLDMLREAGCE